MKNTIKTTMFVAALAAMILGQASVSAADSTPAILKSVKAKQTLNAGQMKQVKGEYYPCYYNYNYNYKYTPYAYNYKYAYNNKYAYVNYKYAYNNKYAYFNYKYAYNYKYAPYAYNYNYKYAPYYGYKW